MLGRASARCCGGDGRIERRGGRWGGDMATHSEVAGTKKSGRRQRRGGWKDSQSLAAQGMQTWHTHVRSGVKNKATQVKERKTNRVRGEISLLRQPGHAATEQQRASRQIRFEQMRHWPSDKQGVLSCWRRMLCGRGRMQWRQWTTALECDDVRRVGGQRAERWMDDGNERGVRSSQG